MVADAIKVQEGHAGQGGLGDEGCMRGMEEQEQGQGPPSDFSFPSLAPTDSQPEGGRDGPQVAIADPDDNDSDNN